MAQHYNPKITTENLVLSLDPSHNKSYPAIDLPVKGGLILWLDAADDTTFSYSSGTTVSQWRDKSGFNYHMTPPSSGPTRSTSQNSRKVVAFTTAQNIQNSTIDLRNSAYSIFVVDRYTNASSGTGRILTSNSSYNNWLLGHWASETNKYYGNGWVYQTYSAADTNWKLYLGDWGGPSNDSANFYATGTALATNSTGADAGPWYLGVNIYGTELSNCEVAEIIVFNRLLSVTERKLVHTYLGQKWGILNTDNHGLLGNGTTADMPAADYYNKGALRFDGSSDYLVVADNVILNPAKVTVSMWLKRNAYQSSICNFLRRNDRDAYALMATYNTDTVWFRIRNAAAAVIDATTTMPLNTWTNLVGTFDGSNVKVYKDGVLANTTANTSAISYSGSTIGDLIIARDDIVSGRYAPINVGSTLIYSRALSAVEIAQNYEAQKSKFANTIVQQGLVLNLDAGNPYSYAGAGTTWYDVSGNSNHATLYNSPTWNSNGYFSLNGTNNYIKTTSTLNLSAYNAVTVLVIFKARSYPVSGNTKFICELSTDFNSFQYGFVWTYNDNSASQNYDVFAGVKGNNGYNLGVWNKSNYNDLNWEISTAVFDKSQTTAEASLYNQGVAATVITNPLPSLASNNTNNFGDDYLFIGSRAGTSYFTDLDIASILVYNRALSAAEILQNYNATKGRFGL